MYTIDENDKIIEQADIPNPDTATPFPKLIANDYRCVLSYECARPEYGRYALITFAGDLYFGSPNDEAIGGHPLAARGLHAYAAFEVIDSSWIRLLEVRNRVHSRHDPRRFSKLRHIIITFHDSTFEFVTESFSLERLNGDALLSSMLAKFRTSSTDEK
jgi:hypothetical protein